MQPIAKDVVGHNVGETVSRNLTANHSKYVCHPERGLSPAPRDEGESKDLAGASLNTLRQGILSMLFCENASMPHSYGKGSSGSFGSAPFRNEDNKSRMRSAQEDSP